MIEVNWKAVFSEDVAVVALQNGVISAIGAQTVDGASRVYRAVRTLSSFLSNGVSVVIEGKYVIITYPESGEGRFFKDVLYFIYSHPDGPIRNKTAKAV